MLIEIMDENVELAIKVLDSAISMLYEYTELTNVNAVDEISLLGDISDKLERKTIKDEITRFEELYVMLKDLAYFSVGVYPMENKAGFYFNKNIIGGKFNKKILKEEKLVISEFESMLQNLTIKLGFHKVEEIMDNVNRILKLA